MRVSVLLNPFTVTGNRTSTGLNVSVEAGSVYPRWKVEPPSVNVTVEGIPSG